jgi:hypothetical protein
LLKTKLVFRSERSSAILGEQWMNIIETDGVQMKKIVDEQAHDENDQTPGEMSEEEIDNNLEDTFPASDPPSWTLGSNHRSVKKQETESKDDHED